MHLLTFEEAGKTRIGVLNPEMNSVADLSVLAPELPQDMLGLILQGEPALARASDIIDSGEAQLPVAKLKLLAPIPRPLRNILCVGKNYPEHVKEVQSVVASEQEQKSAVPESPIIFTKATSSIIGPGESIPAWLDATNSVDYEGELAVVIGRAGRNISRDNAMSHIFGYSIINDVTSRRMQRKHQQWFLGKSLDGFCPMGPCIVTRDEIDNVGQLRVQTRVNDELRQDGYVRDMIFDIPSLIETLSAGMTLEPGDIIATGTPAGVGMGFKPPKFLQKGDKVSITINPIGTLVNTVV
jgi:2-keto-4-pentenoate hydratase/2-oxohepta-3-ene-1,7-dioic acid hydratase in catechol pathway